MRVLSAVLALVMVLSTLVVFPLTVHAETTVWDGTSQAKPAGSGTEADPYLIANGANLAWMSENANLPQNPATKPYYKQTADIDLGGHTFKSIGWQFSDTHHGALAFYGNYDGCGFKISNAKVINKRTDHAKYYKPDALAAMRYNYDVIGTTGLFGAVHESTLKNINLVNIQVGTYNPDGATINDVYSTNYAGGLVGAARNTTIENCTIDSTSSVYGGWGAGGIIGLARTNVTITRCSNNATVIADLFAGGIVGVGHTLNVSYCINNGKVMVDNRGHAGQNLQVGGICAIIDVGTDAINSADIVETFKYCLNGEDAVLWTASNQTDFKSYQGGILGVQNNATNKYLFSYCYNLATNTDSNPEPFKSMRPVDNGGRIKQGAICGQVTVNADKATMEYCRSVNAIRYTVEGDLASTYYKNAVDLQNENTANLLAGLVAGNGDSGDVKYWTATGNVYGATAADIKSSKEYLDIVSGSYSADEEGTGAVYRGHQASLVANDGTYDIRLIATIDSLDYEEVGFEIDLVATGLNVTDHKQACEYVYTSLIGKADGITYTYTPEEMGGKYLMALALENFTKDMGTVAITVKPYWVTEGTTNYGAAYVVTYNGGAYVSQAALATELSLEDYSIVLSSESTVSGERYAAVNLQKNLKAASGVTLPIETAAACSNEKQIAFVNVAGMDGYAVRMDGEKLLIEGNDLFDFQDALTYLNSFSVKKNS